MLTIFADSFLVVAMFFKKVVCLIILSLASLLIQANGSNDILLQIQKMGTGHRVLYIAPHPDDDNTRLISWLTHAKKLISLISYTW